MSYKDQFFYYGLVSAVNLLKTLQIAPVKNEQISIDELEDSFLRGDREKLTASFCPICRNRSTLVFSISKGLEIADAPSGRRFKAGITIWCEHCKSMISHLDGYCPAWAESIEDWQDFSERLK